jgi:frataxin-like iron-binding protein CyaY
MDNLIEELDRILDKVNTVVNGNLNVTFSDNSESVVSELKQSMDEWLANYQEMLVFTAAIILDIKKQRKFIANDKEKYIEEVNTRIKQLEDMVKDFAYYDLEITDDNIKSKDNFEMARKIGIPDGRKSEI